MKVGSPVLKVVFGSIAAWLDARDTSHNPHTVPSWAHRTHLSPPRGRGYFTDAHGCSDSDCIHRLSWGLNSWNWHAVQVLIQPSVVYTLLPSTISDNDNSCPYVCSDGNTGSPRCHRSLRSNRLRNMTVSVNITVDTSQSKSHYVSHSSKMEDTDNDYVFSCWN